MTSEQDNQPLTPSNGIRLSMGEWAFVAVVTVLGGWMAMATWSEDPAAGTTPDYRLPHELNEDYWFFRQVASRAAVEAEVAVFGDSVIWGAYVRRGGTLPAQLSRSEMRFANLGIQGAHPAALAGLIEHHATAIRGRAVILHVNPLWMSSRRLDLQEDKEFRFNHPDLIPQFTPWVPSYKATADARLGAVVRRNAGFLLWTRHLQFACYDGLGIPAWTIENPDADPFVPLTLPTPPATVEPLEKPMTWSARGIRPQRYNWVDAKTSFQWSEIRRAIEILRSRGNRILVLVGPLNEHAMTDVTRSGYRQLRDQLVSWLRDHDVLTLAPEVLPTDTYADVSHPIRSGYRLLAEEIRQSGLLEELR